MYCDSHKLQFTTSIEAATCSGVWRRVDLVRTHILVECVASIFRVERISQLRCCKLADSFYPEDGDDIVLRNVRLLPKMRGVTPQNNALLRCINAPFVPTIINPMCI
jgi:hypothetical protein